MHPEKPDPLNPSQYRVDWYRTPVYRERLAELNLRSDLRGFIQAGGHLALILCSGSLAWWVHLHLTWPWLLAALLLHGTVSSFSANAMHELVHGTVFRTKYLNEVFAALFSFHYSLNHLAFWASHSEHHKFTLHDPYDQEVLVPMELTLRGFLRALIFDYKAGLWILQFHTSLARGKCDSSWGRYLYGDDPRRFAIFNWSRFVLGGHFLIIVVSLANGWWLLPLLTSLTPVYGRGLNFLMNESQHVGLQDHVSDFRLNARTFRCNPVLRFLYWHMNWHIEHHMYAGVPCYNLHLLHNEVRHDLPYVWKSITEMWFHIITCLYRQKFESDYVYVPEIPGGVCPRDLNSVGASRADRVKENFEAGSGSELPDIGPDGLPWRLWECGVCGFIYDERLGLPEENILPGTRWSDIPDDWRCPDCGVAKADFKMKEIQRGLMSATATSFDPALDKGPLVIVGSGLAGYNLAREYQRCNRRRPLRMITQDDGAFYSKPSISNALAEGKSPGELILKTRDQMEKELDITVTPGCEVLAIDRSLKVLHTSLGDFPYENMVLTLGADPIRLPLEGNAAERVLSVNDLDDYRRFRDALPASGKVLILGAGLVGCEFANDLVANGYGVTVIDPAARPLARLATEEESLSLQNALATIGVDWRFGNTLTTLDSLENEGLRAGLADGQNVDVDLVLSAVGLRPRVTLARNAGLLCGAGGTM